MRITKTMITEIITIRIIVIVVVVTVTVSVTESIMLSLRASRRPGSRVYRSRLEGFEASFLVSLGLVVVSVLV